MKTVILKQLRLFSLWIYYALTVAAILNFTIQNRSTSNTEEELTEGFIRYIDCVYGDPDDTDCKLTDYIDYQSFGDVYFVMITQAAFPIVIFLVFGAKKSMLLFWKEYIQYMWKNKTITFQFEPSFDSTAVSMNNIRSLGNDENDINNEDTKFRRLKKLKRRIKEI